MAASTIQDLHPDVLTGALRLLDAPTLATAACATSVLRAAASQPQLWEDLCLAAWPSLRHPRVRQLLRSAPGSFHSFFSDAHPFPHPGGKRGRAVAGGARPPRQLISAVDLIQKGEPIFSRVVETEARGSWFLCSPFRVEALGVKEFTPPPIISPAELTMSWIVMDPAGHRAVNLSSRGPVSVERQWYTGEIMVRFTVVLDGGAVAAAGVVVCDEETMRAREVRLTLENLEGATLNGGESLAVLQRALEGERKGGGEDGPAEARRRYAEYEERRRERKERSLKREGRLDLCCIVLVLSLLLGLLSVAAR